MPPARSTLIQRRRSSIAKGLMQVKPGNYGVNTSVSPRALTFAPNVTPVSYVEADDDLNESMPPSPSSTLFPPTEATSAPSRRRLPPGKRLSQGYIPRPPNAFMLFRANFVRQKHVPGSIETNHGSLSKIIGNCWRALPLDEKKYWENLAKKAKAAHRERYPNYRFRPVHNKNKNKANANGAANDAAAVDGKRKEKLPPMPADEERCEVVAQLLLEGKKGEELAAAVRQIELARAMESRPESVEPHYSAYAQPQIPLYMQRRSSSVPPPSSLYNTSHAISIPTLPFLVQPTPQYGVDPNGMFAQGYAMGTSSVHPSRAPSPVSNIARQRTYLGMRRASSVQPIPSERMWDAPFDPHQQHQYNPYGGNPTPAGWQLQPDWSPLPEVNDATIFQPGWTCAFTHDAQSALGMQGGVAPDAQAPHHPLHVSIGPLDSFQFGTPAPTPSSTAGTDAYAMTPYAESVDPHTPWPISESGPPSTISGSPTHSDASLPTPAPVPMMCAPQPQHAHSPDTFDAWVHAEQLEHEKIHAHGHGVGVGVGVGMGADLALELEEGYVAQAQYSDMYGMEMDMGAVGVGAPEYGYCPQEQVY